MRRKEFIQYLSSGILLLAVGRLPQAQAAPGRTLRFGVLTDTHYADRPTAGTRHYADSLQKVDEAIEAFNRAKVDFVIELGDLKDMDAKGTPELTLRYLDSIEQRLRRFDGPLYHVLGNHDMDCITKEEFLAHTSNAGRANGRAYYSFEAQGVRCIVLDANFNADMTPYSRGNFDWRVANIPTEQLDWLEGELTRHRRQPTIIFLHQMLDSFSDINKDLCVKNADKAVEIIERHEQVLAVIQGHHHPGHYSFRRGVHYLTLNGMIEQAAPTNSYAIVEVRPSGDISVDGFKSCPDRELSRQK
ncbi:MAG: metallophosphoesterase [Alistipes sp.]|nr:metallophosphoesterase [Alistipes sp.]